MSEYRIEDGVPLPTGNFKKGSPMSDTIAKLQEGQSFLIPAAERYYGNSNVSNHNITNRKKGSNLRYIIRKVSEDQYRIWCIRMNINDSEGIL